MDKSNLSGIASNIRSNLQTMLDEHRQMQEKLSYQQVATLVHELRTAARVFVAGAGRSGLALRAAAMRLMHLGLTVYVSGETVTPAIQKGDLLLVASGSGTTPSILHAAEKAASLGATVIALSTNDNSPLSKVAKSVIQIPAAQKTDFGSSISHQYAGSLFEQGILLLTDALFQTMWQQDGSPAEDLWKRHANLE